MNDLAFAEQLRALLDLKPDADLALVSDPSKRRGGSAGWLYRPMPPSEKKAAVKAYCDGDSASNIAVRHKRGRGTIVTLLKGVKIYLSPREKGPRKDRGVAHQGL